VSFGWENGFEVIILKRRPHRSSGRDRSGISGYFSPARPVVKPLWINFLA
jgi:hypothetical protein